jgi:hypothetical protein
MSAPTLKRTFDEIGGYKPTILSVFHQKLHDAAREEYCAWTASMRLVDKIL